MGSTRLLFYESEIINLFAVDFSARVLVNLSRIIEIHNHFIYQKVHFVILP